MRSRFFFVMPSMIKHFLSISVVSAGLALSVCGAEVFEDFSTWENGPEDTNGNATLDIADGGSSTNDWTQNRVYSVEALEGGKDLVLSNTRGQPLSWNQIGKAHGLPLTDAKALEISMRVANPREKGATSFLLLLGNETRNGYGLFYGGLFPMKNRVGVSVVKWRDSDQPFGSKPLPKVSIDEGYRAEGDTLTKFEQPISPGQFVDLHMRIEQEKAGSPVILTVWNTGCDEVPDTSYEEPLLKLEDDGSGAVFRQADGSHGPIMDLATLTYIGLSASQQLDKNATPAESAAEPGLRFRNVDVKVVP